MLNFKILREENVIGPQRFSIFDKIGIYTSTTDFGIITSNYYNSTGEKNNFPYWLDSYEYETVITIPNWVWNNIRKEIRGKYIGNYNLSSKYVNLDIGKIGVRPIVSYSEIKSEIIHEYINEDLVKVALAFEFPQEYTSLETSHDLDLLYINNVLNKTQKSYTFRECNFRSNCQEYEFRDEHFVKPKNRWISVSPIEWYIDEDADIAISKYVLFGGIPFVKDALNYDGNFENSELNDFLNNTFAKEIIVSQYCKDAAYQTPSKTSSSEIEQILLEIKFWENFEQERLENMKNLKLFKQLVQEGKSLSEINQLVNVNNLINNCIESCDRNGELVKQKKYRF